MRVGVIGTGIMGKNHVHAYSSLLPRCQIIGIYDVNHEQANQLAKQYGIVAYQNISDLLDRVDAVSISVPTKLHFQVGKQCLERGKHVLMEKPIAETTTQAELLIELANKHGVKLHAGQIELFNPVVNVLKDILNNEEVLAIEMHRFSPYQTRHVHSDVVKNLMLHDIYLLEYLINRDITSVQVLGCLDGLQNPNHAAALVQLKGNIVAQLTASYYSITKVRTIHIMTKQATINTDLIKKTIEIIRKPSHNNTNTALSLHERVEVPEVDSLKNEIIDFLEAVEKDSPSRNTGFKGLKALALSERVIQLIKSGEQKNNSPNGGEGGATT